MKTLNTISEALLDYQAGKMLVVVDDEDRENEGDLILAGEFATSQNLNFMIKEARGLVCTPISKKMAKKLDVDYMVPHNTSPHQTAFTVSIDASNGITTGISAYDRAVTIQKMVNSDAKPTDFIRPGHIFPLIAHEGGLSKRQGHTEAALELNQLCQFSEVAIICEILNDDGTMARLPDLIIFAQKFNLKIISIKDLIDFKNSQLSRLKPQDTTAHVKL
jgi:3,4-dihydroxy 2-butanone 4-phosphate synthase/GTP cyclohydrolase II